MTKQQASAARQLRTALASLKAMEGTLEAALDALLAVEAPDEPEYLTKTAAARYLGRSVGYVAQRVREGQLTEYTDGLLKVAELKAFAEAGGQKAQDARNYRVV